MPQLQGVNHQEAIKALQKANFRIIRQSKHIIMSDGEHFVSIPRANPINSFTMGAIIKGSGLTVMQFKELL